MHDMIPAPHALPAFECAPARLTIDRGAVVDNWRKMAALSGPAKASAVVKADAYGLGAIEIGTALAAAGCDTFFVATPEEGARLRKALANVRIFVLSGMWPGMEAWIFGHRLIPVLGSMEQMVFFRGLARNHPFALYVDTGMNRLGLTIEDAAALARNGDDRLELVMSHLACPDIPAHPMNRQQLQSFQGVARFFAGVEASLSSSAGIMLGEEYHFDLTRPGIALYGGEAVGGALNPMRPVVRAEARILQIRTVRRGEAASYGATHVFERDSRLAIVGAGYADGWHRALSGSGVMARQDGSQGASGFVAGHRVPIVGRITMDLTTFDIGAIAENRVATGDYIELFGPNISLDDAARAAGTIGYELLTGLGGRYERRYCGRL